MAVAMATAKAMTTGTAMAIGYDHGRNNGHDHDHWHGTSDLAPKWQFGRPSRGPHVGLMGGPETPLGFLGPDEAPWGLMGPQSPVCQFEFGISPRRALQASKRFSASPARSDPLAPASPPSAKLTRPIPCKFAQEPSPPEGLTCYRPRSQEATGSGPRTNSPSEVHTTPENRLSAAISYTLGGPNCNQQIAPPQSVD